MVNNRPIVCFRKLTIRRYDPYQSASQTLYSFDIMLTPKLSFFPLTKGDKLDIFYEGKRRQATYWTKPPQEFKFTCEGKEITVREHHVKKGVYKAEFDEEGVFEFEGYVGKERK